MGDLTAAARNCDALDRARRIADWVGGGKPLTPKGVLRPVDVRQAAAATGVPVPERFRSAGDVPVWHRPWTVAVATGMVVVEPGRVTAAPPVDITLDLWLRGLAAVLADTFDDDDGTASLRIGTLGLTALAAGEARTPDELRHALWGAFTHELGSDTWRLWRLSGYESPGEPLVELLTEFGALTDQTRPTELGEWALAQLTARGDTIIAHPPAVPADQICQLKITLLDVRPACWRRVLVPATATLGDVHLVVQAAMRWDDDHLHAFTVGSTRYGDPDYDLTDEHATTLGEVFTLARKAIGYTYDFGDDWRHDITLEKTLDVDADTSYPVCVGGSGAVPIEDSQEGMIAFDQDDINRRLGMLPNLEDDDALDEVVEMIVVDAYDDYEQLSSFLTVLEDEVPLPAGATLLGNPVTVLGLDFTSLPRGPFARCRGEHGEGEVALADVCFPPDTVAAWIHAAYRHYLGLKPFPADRRTDWRWPED